MEGREIVMNRVVVTEARVITALGHGLAALYRGLMAGTDGFSRVDRFDTAAYASSIAGLVPGIGGPDPAAGYSAIMTLAAQLLENLPALDKDTLLITASTKAGIDLIHTCAPPGGPKEKTGIPVSDFPGRIATMLGLSRPGFNINAACASSSVALAKAADLISRGREHTVAVLGADLVSEFVFSGFSAIGAMAPEPARPFDRDRRGLTLGEGAALVVLADRELCRRENRPILAELIGWGIAGDATHLTAPDRKASGLKSAIGQACTKAGIRPADIRAFNTHGTGTRYNDAMEVTAIRDLFDIDTLRASSIKGSTGHTLGASGAIEAALCVKLLEQKVLPGTRGLGQPDDGVTPIFSPEPAPFDPGPVLTTNSGFGGINAALVFGEAI